ncbi:MAG: HEAT repeat domain-containing protein [Planctomycetota bacterium]|nr:HEAT repeat domain-containing protein [Planctomycetota bacterium]
MRAGLALLLGLVALLPPGVDDEVDELQTKLRDSDKWSRKTAVEKLARLDRPEAWQLVIDALADPFGEVSDTAQHELGALQDADLIEELLGKRGLKERDEWVRLRAAEALGRLRVEVDGEPLARQLTHKDAELRRTILWTLERLESAGTLGGDRERKILPAVRRAWSKDRDPRVRAKALDVLVTFDAEAAVQDVLAGLEEREAAVRCAAVRALPVLELPLTLGLVRKLGEDESVAVRTEVVEALGLLRSVGACRALVDRLERETELRLAYRIVDHLRYVSGLRHGRDARPWRRWADALEDDWKPFQGEVEEEDEDRSITFVGLPILSERLVVLIDMSGSIWKERGEGKTRKDVVDVKLRECLERLPETTEFNLIPYTADPIPWQKRLVPATRRNVAAAITWFEKLNNSGTGDFWDAYLLALEDPRVDTIVMLGDGEPTGGRRFHFGLLPALVEQENLGRNVAVDSIVVGARKRTRVTWEDIAARTGGRSIAVDL